MTTVQIDTVTYNIGQHFACYIEYGDATGLTDEEQQECDIFLSVIPENVPEGFEFMHTTIGEDVGFDRDEIGGLMGECVELVAVFRRI